MIRRMLILGATGDRAPRYLLPALARLRETGRLPEEFEVSGLARGARDTESFRAFGTVPTIFDVPPAVLPRGHPRKTAPDGAATARTTARPWGGRRTAQAAAVRTHRDGGRQGPTVDRLAPARGRRSVQRLVNGTADLVRGTNRRSCENAHLSPTRLTSRKGITARKRIRRR